MKPYDILKSMAWALGFILIVPPIGAFILIVSSEPAYTLGLLYLITVLHIYYTRKARKSTIKSKPLTGKPLVTS
ncbi:MAG: hypothetical protein MI673_05110 [Thiotrichales bacterium]|nr:hypothetical protein [Thiotrichales bacterium]